MAENFLARRHELPNRTDLARNIEKALYARMGVDFPLYLPIMDTEKRLQQIIETYRSG
jgi:hypothetical protein